MGYYTKYKLGWIIPDKAQWQSSCTHSKPKNAKFCPECGIACDALHTGESIVRALLHAKEVDPDKLDGITEHGESEDRCKWYDHETELADFSKKFPDVLFVLDGEGEESGDLWRKYFRNGKFQRVDAVLTYAPFDEKLLVNVPKES